MLKFSIKSKWIAGFGLAVLALVGVKLSLAFGSFTPADQPTGYVAQDEMTNYDLRSGNETLFRVEYHRERWDGDLIAYRVDGTGDINTATQPWVGAGSAFQLDLQGANRFIVTRNSAGTAIPFTWTSLDATQQGLLTSNSILDYVRGVRTNEAQNGGALRQRESPLGDIIHSRPYYVKDATAPTVFVGSNDGMLHAFNATTGAERWAYIPSMLVPKLKNLTVNPYVHTYFVDASPNVGTILSGSKRVLVGGLGAGGQGLYALNITGSSRLAPATEADAATNALWEITPASSGFGNMGYTYSTPVITKVNVSGTSTDVVIIGNGYQNSGDTKGYLYVINADTGALISAIAAGTSTNNGLSSPTAVDENRDGDADAAFAGDLNGTMWKFDLSPLATGGAATSRALLVTNPAQPITMTPGVARHPNGGYMVNFVTGSMLTTADATDTSDYAAYGIWDTLPAGNDTLLTQTLTERCYTTGTTAQPTPCASRVRTATSNQPDWTAGAGHHIGWKVVLPTNNGTHGEKVVGDGSYIENGRFYFTASNPNISTTVLSSTVKGENWLMELDYLTGGSKNSPFLDLSSDQLLTDDDRVKDSATPRAPVMTTDGIPVGKMIGIGVLSQPILVQLTTLNNTLFNQNPDVAITSTTPVGVGVTGGHFDVDFFHTTPTSGTSASATITVGTTGQSAGIRAAVGDITVNGVIVIPAQTANDIANGTATATNAALLASKVTNGFTATVSGSTITIKAPKGALYNGSSITIGQGTSSTPQVAAAPAVVGVTGVTGVAPTAGTLVFTAVAKNKTVSLLCGGTYIGSSGTWTSSNSNTAATRLTDFKATISGSTVNGYTTTCAGSGPVTCTITAPVGVSACSGGFTVDSDITTSTNTGPSGGVTPVTAVTAVPAVAAQGWTNFAGALTATAFNTAGAEPTTPGDTCTGTNCTYDRHVHQYDDVYDVTGVNTLSPSDSNVKIDLAIASLTLPFKILVQNQYLSPAVELHIGDPSYVYNVDFGYIQVKNYGTSATLDPVDLQTYVRNPNAAWPNGATTALQKAAMPKPIGSLAWNMPLDALDVKDWWGNGDLRVGLMPMKPQCMWQAEGTYDGNMYKPVVPPANGTDGPGTKGWSSSTTPATATGARHGGALMLQLIRDTTPASAIEQNVSGRPEYGWRVKSSQFSTYVLAEFGTYWHHPNQLCFYDTGWTKQPPKDNGSSTPKTKAAGSTDPHIGDLSAGGGSSITNSTTTVVGNVTTTTITYSNGTYATITRTANSDGTVTIVTRDASGNTTTESVANAKGTLKSGGDERGLQARTGRVSWHELVTP